MDYVQTPNKMRTFSVMMMNMKTLMWVLLVTTRVWMDLITMTHIRHSTRRSLLSFNIVFLWMFAILSGYQYIIVTLKANWQRLRSLLFLIFRHMFYVFLSKISSKNPWMPRVYKLVFFINWVSTFLKRWPKGW